MTKELKVMQYELEFDSDRMDSITLNRVLGVGVERWAIRIGTQQALGKTPDEHGLYQFHIETLPSSRDDEYYAEYRWTSAEEALRFWKENRRNIIATTQEKREHYWSTHPATPLKL